MNDDLRIVTMMRGIDDEENRGRAALLFRRDRPYSRGNQLENHCVNDPMIR